MKTTPIEIDKHRKLRYDFNAIADLEAVTRKPLAHMVLPLSLGSFDAIRALLWAGLKWEDPKLTVAGAGNLAGQWIEMSGSDVGGLTEVLMDALIDAGWFEPKDANETLEGDGQGEVIQASTN